MESIILIAQQISSEGKVPSTALIKARLPNHLALPTIIQGLKMWQKNPQQVINMPIDSALSAISNAKEGSVEAQLEAKIAQAIAPLEAQIQALQIAMQALQKQIKTENGS